MAKNVGDKLFVTKANTVNIDDNYGPYSSIDAAYAALYEKDIDTVIGITVGIIQQDGSIKEYWLQPPLNTETHGFVPKSGGTTDYNNLDNKPTINKTGSIVEVPLQGTLEVNAETAQGMDAEVTLDTSTLGKIKMNFILPRGADGRNGAPGNNGHNPCLGRFTTLPTLSPNPFANARNGDYIYFDTTDSQTSDPVTYIYHFDGTNWDAGTVVDVSNETFGSGQSVPSISIKDLDGEDDQNATGVLSAEAGKSLNFDVNGGTDATVIGSNTSAPSWSGKKCDTNGNLVTATATKLCTPVRLLAGEKLKVVQQYIPSYASIILTDETLTTNLGIAATAGYNKSYTAQQDCYVAAQINTDGTYSITKSVQYTGVKQQIEGLGNSVAGLQEDVAELSAADRPLVLGSDYTKETTGYAINPATGVVQEQTNAWISSVIAVKYGDVLELTPDYSMGNFTSVAKTDAEKTYYRPLLTNSTASKHVVPIYFDGYIVVACPNNSITLTLVLKSLSADNYKIVSDNVRAQKNNAISALSTRADERDGTLNTRYTQEFNAAVKQALFEREVMLAEVHAMTNDDVLAGGDCGYVINNDDPTDVTHGTIHWKIYKNGILYIYGYGRMYDYLKGTQACKTIASVNSFMQSYLVNEPYGWYYGFLSPNLNGITPVEAPRGYKYRDTDTDVMVYQNKRYAPNGDTINAEIKALVPTYNRVYGYAAPWYIYRTDPDLDPTNSNADYQNLADYNGRNPTSIRYNRVCIEEDLAHGGITYIGDWAFYRCTAPTLVLPDHVTAIGCWGIRYSPTIRTVVMGDMVTEMEDNSLTRMEAMAYVKLSSALQTLKYETMSMNSSLRYLSLPSGITSLPEYFGYADVMLDYLIVRGSGMLSIAKSAFTNCPLSVLDIKSGVGATSIGNSAFFGGKFLTVRIPQSVTSIVTDAFADTNVKVVIIDSSSIAGLNASIFSTAAGRLFANAEVLYIKNTIETIGATIKRYFEYFKDEGDYKVYTRLVV